MQLFCHNHELSHCVRLHCCFMRALLLSTRPTCCVRANTNTAWQPPAQKLLKVPIHQATHSMSVKQQGVTRFRACTSFVTVPASAQSMASCIQVLYFMP